MPKLSLMQWLGLGVAGLVLLAAGVGSYYASQARELKMQLEELQKSPQAAGQEDILKVVEAVTRHIEVPGDETPTLATVTDKERLSDNQFFTKAENGDKVLIYVNAKKAYLYRPSADRLVEVATVNLSAGQETAAPARVWLRNGTAEAGLTRAVEATLQDKLPSLTLTGRDNAKTTDRAETRVVDLSGKQAETAQAVADALGAKVGDLPAGEVKPADADILVLVGQDRVGR